MILTGNEIIHEHKCGRITIEPFREEQVNPNSYNFRLNNVLRVYQTFPLDPKINNPYDDLAIPESGFVLQPKTLYLASTIEKMGSEYYAPTYSARSSIARLGLFINLSASLGDIGFVGNWTIQLYSIHSLKVYAGMNIGQIMWWKPKGKIILYCGKYQGSQGPQSTLIYKDYEQQKLSNSTVSESILKY